MLSNPTPSRPGALPFPKALKIQMTLLQMQGSDVDFELGSSTPGVVVPGDPPKISLVGIRQPVLITIQLVAHRFSPLRVNTLREAGQSGPRDFCTDPISCSLTPPANLPSPSAGRN